MNYLALICSAKFCGKCQSSVIKDKVFVIKYKIISDSQSEGKS